MTARAYLALGSNLGDRARNLGDARAALIGLDDLAIVALSSVAETAPVDVLDQPSFLNQVVAVDARLGPGEVLAACLAIEQGLGRDRAGAPPRGPRTIDLDVLLYGGRAVEEAGLTVPHPRLARRPFLLALLREAGAPEAWLPAPEAT